MKASAHRHIGTWLLLCLLSSCSGDNYHYPSVKLEFLTAYSGSDGYLRTILTDEGELLPVTEDKTNTKVTADSAIRIISNYATQPSADGTPCAKLYALNSVISPLPKAAGQFKEGIKTDPADVLSIWMGLGYLNMTLEVKENGKHLLHFIEDEIVTNPANGCREVRITLYHDAEEETVAYTRRIYASIPVAHYAEAGVTHVTIRFSIHTYSGEVKTFSNSDK